MTEPEWRTGTDIQAILQHALADGAGRKVRLFNCACARALVPWVTDPAVVKALDASERYADGRIKDATLDRWGRKVLLARRAYLKRTPSGADGTEYLAIQVSIFATNTDQYAGYKRVWSEVLRRMPQYGPELVPGLPERMADFLRDVVGNPFLSVAFADGWRTEPAVALARTMYESRAFDRMPILADALEEAGCDVPEVLAHCRDPAGVHVRGCWVVDGVLGKS